MRTLPPGPAPIKRIRKVAKAEEAGKLSAQYEQKMRAHEITPKTLLLSAREHFGKLIDSMTFKDVVDVVAAAGLTPVIHAAILGIPSVVKTLTTLTPTELGAVLGSIIVPGIGTSFGALIGIITADMFKQWITPEPVPEKPKEPTTEERIQEFLGWLLAFAIAWIIVRWGDKMVNAGIGELAGIIKLLGI